MPKVAIMITSCDAYKECWKPMIYSLDKYWPDCEFPRYIVTNFETEDLPNTQFINIGNDDGWCTLTKRGLAAIDCDYIIFFQDDYWLCSKVNNDAIKAHIKYFEENNLDYLKLQDDTRRDNYRIGNTDYCMNPLNIRYSINTSVAIWRKSTIDRLIISGWSGWQWERSIISYIKTNRIELSSQILYSAAFKDKGIAYVPEGAVLRGRWTPWGIEFLHKNGFENLIKQRKAIGKIYTLIWTSSPKNRYLRIPVWGVLRILRGLGLIGI